MSGGSEPNRPPVVVIGAGAAGLAAALRLAEAGLRVRVLEASRRLGGRASSFHDRRSGRGLDWGPHLFMAANPALRSLVERVGATASLRFSPALELTYRRPAPGGVRLERLAFPARGGALAQLAALLRWRGPGPWERLGIARGLMRLLRGEGREEPEETVAGMLDRLGQGGEARRWFWEPFARAVLNLPLEKGSAALFRRVIREAFGGGPSGAALGVPQQPLSPFWADRAAERIRALGGEVRIGAPAEGLLVEEGGARGVRLTGGGRLEAAAVVSAVPPPAALALLPEDLRGAEPWRGIGRLGAGPIASAYLWLDGPAPGPAFEAVLDEPWHWLFRPAGGGGGAPVALLAGGEDSVASHGKGALERAARESAARLFPGRRAGRIAVVRERAATWANGAGEQAWRPGAETPLARFFLAGDWTATGLPATVEGAVRSGDRAAEAVLREVAGAPAFAKGGPAAAGAGSS